MRGTLERRRLAEDCRLDGDSSVIPACTGIDPSHSTLLERLVAAEPCSYRSMYRIGIDGSFRCCCGGGGGGVDFLGDDLFRTADEERMVATQNADRSKWRPEWSERRRIDEGRLSGFA